MERGDVVQDCEGELWVVDVVLASTTKVRVVRYSCDHDGLICKHLAPHAFTKVGHTKNIPDLRNC